MKTKFIFSFLLLLLGVLLCTGCYHSKEFMQTHGDVFPQNHYAEFDFRAYKGVIYFPVVDNTGQKKNFFFDTGAELTTLHKKVITGKIKRLRGASGRSIRVGSEIVPYLKIQSISFNDIYTLNTNLGELNEYVDDFGGIIGQSIIRKSNWLIDFPKKKIKMSNKNLTDSDFDFFKVQLIDGSPFAFIKIDGKEYRFLIDLGSNTTLTVPSNTILSERLLSKYKFYDSVRNIVSLDDNKNVKEKVGVLPNIKLGNIDFQNETVRIFSTSHARIGAKFFENQTLYIDNSYRQLYGLKKN